MHDDFSLRMQIWAKLRIRRYNVAEVKTFEGEHTDKVFVRLNEPKGVEVIRTFDKDESFRKILDTVDESIAQEVRWWLGRDI